MKTDLMRLRFVLLFFQLSIVGIANMGYSQVPDSLLKLSLTETDQERLFEIYFELGNYYLLTRLDSSADYFEKTVALANKIGSDSLLGIGYNGMGRVYIYAGLFDKSLDYFYKALTLNSQNDVTRMRLLANIGTVYYRTGDLEKALELYGQAETLIKATRDILEPQKYHYYYGSLLNNAGAIFENQHRYDTALQVYTRGLTQSKAAHDTVGLANLYTNIGKLYQMLEKYNLAEPNFLEAFQLRVQTGDEYGMARSYAHLGGLFRDMKRYDAAVEYLEKSVEMSKEIGSLEVEASSTSLLADIYSKNGYYEKAFWMLDKSIELKDSLNRETDTKKMAQVEMQYEFDKKQREAEIAQQKREVWMAAIIIGLIFFVLVAVLLFILQRIRANNEQLQKEHFSLANKNLVLAKRSLEESLEYKNKELTTNVMYLMKKNELLNDISQRLLDIKKSTKSEEKEKIHKIIMELNSATNDDVWEDFELRFNEVYNDFYERLMGQFPHLTANDRKLCAFLRLNLSSKEICAITRQSTNSLNVSRARLRKKLGIDNSDTALITFLEKI